MGIKLKVIGVIFLFEQVKGAKYMNIEYLNSFIETVSRKSLSKASERLNISQPALSKQIHKIEEYFGTVLLKRTTSGVELTEAGKLLFERIPKILDELSSIQSDLKHLNGIQSFTIGTLPSLAGNFIPPKILKLEEKGIDTEVLVKNTSEEVFELLKKGEINVAIIEEMPKNRFFWQKKILEEPFYVIVHNSHRLSKYESVSLEEIKNEKLILYPSNCTIRQSILKLVKDIKVKTEVEFGEFLIGYVAAGGGITVVPEITAKHLGYPMVKAIPINEPNLRRHISIISHSNSAVKFLYPFFKQ